MADMHIHINITVTTAAAVTARPIADEDEKSFTLHSHSYIHFHFLCSPPSFISFTTLPISLPHPIYLSILYSFLSQDPSNGVTMRRWLGFSRAWQETPYILSSIHIRALLNNSKLTSKSARVLKIQFHTPSTKTPDMFRSSSDYPQGVLHRTSIYRYAPHNDVLVNERPHIRWWSPKIRLILILIRIHSTDWTLWSVPSPELQLLPPTFLRSSNCSPSLWSVVVWF
jgi:hypothetical protein